MIIGVGVDTVKVERFEELSDSFMKRVYTCAEREYLSGKKAQSAAGIFAAKEAVAKALGTGFSNFSPKDIEILHEKNGKPFAVLHNNAKQTGITVHLSISHSATDAVAFAVASA